AVADVEDAEARVEHGSVGEALLVADVGEPGGGAAFGGALLGDERGDSVVGRVVAAVEEARRHAVGGTGVGLELEEIAAPEEVVGVGVGGSSGMKMLSYSSS